MTARLLELLQQWRWLRRLGWAPIPDGQFVARLRDMWKVTP